LKLSYLTQAKNHLYKRFDIYLRQVIILQKLHYLIQSKWHVLFVQKIWYQINGAEFHPVISTVKFHTQFEEKTIVPNLNTYVYISNIYIYIYIYRVSHLNISPPITRLGGQVSKKVSYKSYMVSRGNQNGLFLINVFSLYQLIGLIIPRTKVLRLWLLKIK